MRKSNIEQARKAREQGKTGEEPQQKNKFHGCLLAFITFFTFGLALLIPIIMAFFVNFYRQTLEKITGKEWNPVVFYICDECRHRWQARPTEHHQNESQSRTETQSESQNEGQNQSNHQRDEVCPGGEPHAG
ncbi:MAG: hypothetical protein HC884_04640 [Chloroflexaceae bacterium]|nr:hypothetical protein [Chloroflexaceae bacterium]